MSIHPCRDAGHKTVPSLPTSLSAALCSSEITLWHLCHAAAGQAEGWLRGPGSI